MSEKRPHIVTIALGKAEDLFAPADTDPFSPHFDPTPAIDKVVSGVGALTLRERRRGGLHFSLREGADDPGITSRLQLALSRYCTAHIAELAAEREVMRHIGWRELWTGLGMLALCLILSTAISNSSILPHFAERLFVEGLIIAGWVVLWRPVETLIFDAGRLNGEVELLEAIAQLPITVKKG